jgi:hypothetical protein
MWSSAHDRPNDGRDLTNAVRPVRHQVADIVVKKVLDTRTTAASLEPHGERIVEAGRPRQRHFGPRAKRQPTAEAAGIESGDDQCALSEKEIIKLQVRIWEVLETAIGPAPDEWINDGRLNHATSPRIDRELDDIPHSIVVTMMRSMVERSDEDADPGPGLRKSVRHRPAEPPYRR